MKTDQHYRETVKNYFEGLVRNIFSIKHDLPRSCFQLWPKIGDEGDKISRERTGEAFAETVYRNFVILGADFESQN